MACDEVRVRGYPKALKSEVGTLECPRAIAKIRAEREPVSAEEKRNRNQMTSGGPQADFYFREGPTDGTSSSRTRATDRMCKNNAHRYCDSVTNESRRLSLARREETEGSARSPKHA